VLPDLSPQLSAKGGFTLQRLGSAEKIQPTGCMRRLAAEVVQVSENMLLVLFMGACLVIWLGIYAYIHTQEEEEE
jgi:hypothetical protein